MPYTVIIHVAGEEAVVGELPELPGTTDTSILVRKVRRRDGKPVHYLAPGVDTVIWPIDRLTFIEVVPERRAEARPEAEDQARPAAAPAPPEPEPAPPAAPRPSLLSRRPGGPGQPAN